MYLKKKLWKLFHPKNLGEKNLSFQFLEIRDFYPVLTPKVLLKKKLTLSEKKQLQSLLELLNAFESSSAIL
jgi:hypothetical protein